MKKLIKLCLISLIVFSATICGVGFNCNNTKSSEHELKTIYQHDSAAYASLPSSYDLREDIDIGVENQNPYEICYAYASLTSLETYLALHYGEYYDFSELHFAISLYKQEGYYDSVYTSLHNGGNFTHFITYTQKPISIVLQEEMPLSRYTGSNKYSLMESDYNNINNNFYSVAKVNDTKSFESYAGNKAQYSSTTLASFRTQVKQHIQTYGSLTAGIYTDSNVFDIDTVDYKITDDSLVMDNGVLSETKIIKNINHLVSIVGWDDNYNANGAWSNKGAYLCLNSWGENFGEDGYFYVSYDDYFIESNIQGIVDASLCTTNNKISTIANNPKDTFIITHTFDNNINFANIIDTSKYLNQQINYIDTFVEGASTKFYVKFFSSYQAALSGINGVTVMNLANSSKIGKYSIYYKHQLSSPIAITNNYMVIITSINGGTTSHSLGGYVSNNVSLEPTYYTLGGLGSFETDVIWEPKITDQYGDVIPTSITIPLILHTNSTYVKVGGIESDIKSYTNSIYIKNNTIFNGKTISLALDNIDMSQINVSNIKITRPSINSFKDFSSNFNIAIANNKINITMTTSINNTFVIGTYLVNIPYGDSNIYRAIEVQNDIAYLITYNLDGGQATNPTSFTRGQSSLTLNNPIKPGYTFIGWYTDSLLTQSFDPNNLPEDNLTLYAKYDFAAPSISNKSNNINITYSKNWSTTISITATHHLLNQYNTLSYQWYWRKNATDMFELLSGQTNNNITINSVGQSGYYACEVKITITDPSLVTSPCVKTLAASEDKQISVNVKPYIYDMSKVTWNYSQPIAYDADIHKVELINLPDNVTANYTNNEFSTIGTYVAHAELVYDDMNGNATANPVEDLTWTIRPAKITITIKDIISTEAIPVEDLPTMLDCTIEHEYLPENVVTKQEIIAYLQLSYAIQDTYNNNIKTITATYKAFEGDEDVYDIEVISGQYRVVIYTLTNNNITTTNQDGFVIDCIFGAELAKVTDDVSSRLKNKNLNIINAYTLNYSYLPSGDKAVVNIPVERKQILNNASVYMLKNNQLIELDSSSSANGISFTTSEQNATYILVYHNNSTTTNSQILVAVIILGIYLALCAYAVISAIKHKND